MFTEQIWKNFSPALHRFLVKQTSSKADADDLLQDIFVKIHLKSHEIERPEALPAWVWQISRNAVTDHFRRKKRALAPAESLETMPAEAVETNLNQLFADTLRPLLELLPEEKREAVRLADFEKMSQKELAEKWGISHSGAKSRVQRARAELGEQFLNLCNFEFDRLGNIVDFSCPKCGPSREC